jgi:hypothetical protein
MAAWVSRSIAAQSGLATNLRATVISSGEDRRRDGGVSGRRETVADRANVVIDPKDFLDHHQRPFGRRCGIGAVAAQLKIIRSGQFDITSHGTPVQELVVSDTFSHS